MRPKDPIEELHESRVFKRHKKISDDYAQRATRFVSEIAPVLASTSKFFPITRATMPIISVLSGDSA